MADQHPGVSGGVDSHADTHHAAVVDPIGRHLGDAQFPTADDGYRALLAWLRSFRTVIAVGVEGTGSYGTQLARVLAAAGLQVFDINRPDRRMRRQLGKSDPVDAYAPPGRSPPDARASSPRPTPAPPRGCDSAQELETAARLGLHFTHVILRDNSYDMVRFQEKLKYGRASGPYACSPEAEHISRREVGILRGPLRGTTQVNAFAFRHYLAESAGAWFVAADDSFPEIRRRRRRHRRRRPKPCTSEPHRLAE